MLKKVLVVTVIISAILFAYFKFYDSSTEQTLRSLINNKELYLGMQKEDAIKILDNKRLTYELQITPGGGDINGFFLLNNITFINFIDKKKDPNGNFPNNISFDSDGHLIFYMLGHGIPYSESQKMNIFQKDHIPQCNTAVELKREQKTCWTTDSEYYWLSLSYLSAL